jgi:hypothetical protein
MFALLAAASLAAAPATKADAATSRVILDESPLSRGRACGLWDAHPVRREAPTAGASALGEMPEAHHELPVLRLDADGCSVPLIIRRDVSGDGRFAAPHR